MRRSPSRPRQVRAGDLVEVRSAQEILATLDRDSTIDGLPFMPEMLRHCGTTLTVSSRADTTCFYGGLRRLEAGVHLADARCDGSAHGGCQAGCLLFWKEEWLKPIDGSLPLATKEPVPREGTTREGLARATRATAEPGGEPLWSCQATQVRAATTRIPHWNLTHFARDVRNGNLRFRTVLRYLVPYVVNTYQGLSRRYLSPRFQVRGGAAFPFVHGSLTHTPSVTLGLHPGERVQVRSRPEIRATLDRNGRNRGLSFDVEMLPYCGREMRVQRRVGRIIDEWTGRMLDLPGECLVLEGGECRGLYHGLCTRRTDTYWREAWLTRRVGSSASTVEGAAT